jgi:formate dehydrogenase major subunit
MDTITITVNGQPIEARSGQTVLDVVHDHGIDEIPTLCHSPDLKPIGSCFVCVVELKGRNNLVPACSTKVAPGMELLTRSERVVTSRRTALELLLSNHYADCVSPCMEACPAHVDVQGYLALVAMGLDRQALDLIREANPLPAVCGRVCVRKCEVVCRRADVDEPVAINHVKRYASDIPGGYDLPVARAKDTGKTVAIVGAGPAGLTAAWFLGRDGYRSVVYEAMPKPGGMLRYGIPEYRLPNAVLDREVDHICKAGAQIRTGVRIGRDISLEQLRAEHSAVYVAVGAWTGKPMRIAGEFDTEGVVSGIEFLKERTAAPMPVEGTVVVVGGGNTAMDVARTAWRCGAEKVLLIYRRTRAEMPADPLEIQDCIDEGIEIMELVAPVGLRADDGVLQAVRCIRMKLGEPDDSGRRRPIPIAGSEFEIPCQLASAAIGQNPVLAGVDTLDGEHLDQTRWGTLSVDPATGATNLPGVFAGGDAINDGPTVAIDAIADGRHAAAAIEAWLEGREVPEPTFVARKADWAPPGKQELGEVVETRRRSLQHLDVEEREGSFDEVATGFEPEDALHECDRCLECGCVRADDCELRHWADVYGADHRGIKGEVRKHRVDDRHPWITYDPNKCVLCAKCIRTCAKVLPIAALGLVNRGFRTEMRPAMNDPLIETNCVSCGNCVDACPTAALTVKHPFPGRASLPLRVEQTFCGFCSIGCSIEARVLGPGRYELVSPSRPGAKLCRYGRFGYELFFRSERIAWPELRSGHSRARADMALAWAHTASTLREVVEKHGPEAVAVFTSPELTNEELYLAARIAREGLGTSAIGSLTQLARSPESHRLDPAFGFTASTADRGCLAEADLIVCNNTALETDHLVLLVDVLAAVQERGARLVVVNSTLGQADRALSTLMVDPMRGRASRFWQGVLQALLEHAWADRSGPSIDALRALFGDSEDSVAVAARDAGVSEEVIREAATLIASSRRVVFVHGADRWQDQAAGDLETLGNLLAGLRATGEQADLLLPRRYANAAGLEVTGAHPAFLPGRVPVEAADGRATSLADLRERLATGELKAAVVLGEDPLAHPKSARGLQGLELLVAMDWTRTETTRFADVVLPGSTWLESQGTRCSFEGRVLDYAAVTAPPARRAGWEVLAGLARALGVDDVPWSVAELSAQLDGRIHEGLGAQAAWYWNRGEERPETGQPDVLEIGSEDLPRGKPPAITHSARYKRSLKERGPKHHRPTGAYR